MLYGINSDYFLITFMYGIGHGGIERIIAMAFGIHFLADFVTVIVNNYAPVWVVEAALAVFVVGIIGYAYNINKEE